MGDGEEKVRRGGREGGELEKWKGKGGRIDRWKGRGKWVRGEGKERR